MSKITCHALGRQFQVQIDTLGNPTHISVWTKGRFGARDTTRTIWYARSGKTMSAMAIAAAESARAPR